MKQARKNYLKYLNPFELIQTRKVLHQNPTVEMKKNPEAQSVITLCEYNAGICNITDTLKTESIHKGLFETDKQYWLNVDILNKTTIENIGRNLKLHQLIVEDILSDNQRPKVDEIDQNLTCLLHMMYFNSESNSFESEQVSIVLGKNYLISFQDEDKRDLFKSARDKLLTPNSKVRGSGIDYLLYMLIDNIVDHYFVLLDHLADMIEKLEEEIIQGQAKDYTMNKLNSIRKELIFFKRNASPVRDMMNNLIKTENSLITEGTRKYFKDIYDHIVQANDLCENYRDVLTNIRDLYLSQINIKLNEVMKFLAIVTTLMAPATVIGGIFGMNFDKIPYLHHQDGFWLAAILMLIIPVMMLFYFRRKGWF